MVKHKNLLKSDAQPKIGTLGARTRLEGYFKLQLQKLPSWPNLKVADWQALARKEWHLEKNIMSTDPRYWMIHDYCKNFRVRQRKQALKQAQDEAAR